MNTAIETTKNFANSVIESARDFAASLAKLLPSKATATAFTLAVAITLAGASKSHGQVFDFNTINGSIGQPSLLDSNTLAYGLQPFPVTTALTSADGIEYNAAFSTNAVPLPGGNQTGLDVRTWDAAFVYISNLTDALNGTPTASFEFNPL